MYVLMISCASQGTERSVTITALYVATVSFLYATAKPASADSMDRPTTMCLVDLLLRVFLLLRLLPRLLPLTNLPHIQNNIQPVAGNTPPYHTSPRTAPLDCRSHHCHRHFPHGCRSHTMIAADIVHTPADHAPDDAKCPSATPIESR